MTSRVSPTPTALCVAGIAAVVLSSGCATTSPSETENQSAARNAEEASAITTQERLEEVAARQRRSPVPTPAGFDANGLLPPEPDPSDAEARASVDESLARFSMARTGRTLPADAAPDPEAQKAYAAGRLALLAGDAVEATRQLERAVRLDPMSSALRVALGDAMLDAGRQLGGMESHIEAIGLGSPDARPYLVVAADAHRAGVWIDVIETLATFRSLENASPSDLESTLIGLLLGEALIREGWTRAGAELLSDAIEAPPSSIDQRYRETVAALLRRRGQLQSLAGDAFAALGLDERADRAYAEALRLPTLDPDAIVARRAALSIRAGVPAASALMLVDRIRETEGVTDPRFMDLFIALAATPEVGELASELLAETVETSRIASDALADRITAARAACLGSDRAVEILRDTLTTRLSHPLLIRYLASHRRLPRQRPKPSGSQAETRSSSEPSRNRSKTRGRISAACSPSSMHPRARMRVSSRSVFVFASGCPLMRHPRSRSATPPPNCSRRVSSRVHQGDGIRSSRSSRRSSVSRRALPRSPRHACFACCSATTRPLSALIPLIESNPSVSVLLEAASYADAAGRRDEAVALLERAIDLDPFDERPYAGLVAVLGRADEPTNAAILTRNLRELRQRLPSSQLVRTVAVQELLRRRLFAEAERELISLIESSDTDEPLLQRLVGVWAEQGRLGDEEALPRGERWLETLVEKRPHAAAVHRSLARVRAANNDIDGAMNAISRSPFPDSAATASLREEIQAAVGNEPDAARREAIQRLERRTMSIDDVVRHVELLVANGDFAAAARVIRTDLSPVLRLTDPQRSALLAAGIRIVASAQAEVAGMDLSGAEPPPSVGTAIDALAGIERLGINFEPALHRARFELLVLDNGSAQDMLAAADGADDADPRLGTAIRIGALQALEQRGDIDEAIRLGTQLAFADDAFHEGLFGTTLSAIIRVGSVEDAKRLVAAIPDVPAGIAAVSMYRTEDETDPLPDTLPGIHAEVAYFVAAFFGSIDRNAESEMTYRHVLELDPGHALASNDLGYMLADEGRQLDEAERLLINAVTKLPNRASVLDSIGWLRYRQGRLADPEDADADPTKLGAVSLLTRAVSLPDGADNATLYDHLGDAQWLNGDADAATQSWETALKLVNDRLSNAGDGTFADRLRTRRDRLTAKLFAVANGEPPAVDTVPSDDDAAETGEVDSTPGAADNTENESR